MTAEERRRLAAMTNLAEVHAYVRRVGERREKPSAPTIPGKSREERRQEEKGRRAVVRVEVFARVDRERQGRCEWYCAQPATDLHHIMNGGRRTVEERIDTCAGICRGCHRAYEKADRAVLRNAATWAVEHGFREAGREIAHRIDKAEEARGVSRGQHPVTR
jgi:NAD-dependent dihydropyrimidine dehydrogenase PreA subunit